MDKEQPIKRIAIFGSTGSIGTQALDVIAANTDKFSAEVLTAQNNDDLLIRQALQFNPNVVVIGDEKKYIRVKEALAATPIKVFAGEKALEEVALMDCYDLRGKPLPWPIKKPWWWPVISLCRKPWSTGYR